MARQSPNRPDADEPGEELDSKSTALDDIDDPHAETDVDEPAAETDIDADSTADDAAGGDIDRSLWEDVRIEPVEIALPAGAGFTLRAYRLSTELTPTDIGQREDDDLFAARSRRAEEDADDDETVVILDEEFGDQFDTDEETDDPRDRKARGRRTDSDDEDDAADDEADSDAVDSDAESAAADEDDKDEEEPAAEEVPIFLSHGGKLLLFKSPESLVSFVRSGAPNDLAQLDTWDQLVDRLQPADVVPLDEDSYELDLVVENLRGGHDTWDATLLIEAGEVARDLAYALRLPAVLDMLSTGSSLDDLDEALRAAAGGGIGGFMGRRRLRKIGAQTASLGWRTIIGKISAAVDWRD
ncbi:DNA primase [Solwaraspora sp. WMMD1047]|uniref:DNA primase n=1 Tax=Solwaraspora sp. WMMD1047 TaxID=3016102 RepID=UPI002416FBBB|nr:DNA primase [Solwaraspora sp. WMMD1047]MDG4833362.1 DNA primase [Solwaraspora sp. WMMD1047]